MDDYLVEITNPHFSAGMAGYVAVPVPDGDEFKLWTVEGDLVAEAVKDGTGRYLTANGDRYGTWAEALAAATGGRFTPDEVARVATL